MPKADKRVVQKHFPPLTNRSIFRKEPLSNYSNLTSRTEFSLTSSQPSGSSAAPGATTTSSASIMIPKPNGEVSRISRGGYNLEVALGWSKNDYSRVQKGIREIARNHLDMTAILSEQDRSKLKHVCHLAKQQFPELNVYINDWATEDFLSIMLKNSADRFKKLTNVKSSKAEFRRKKSKKSKEDSDGEESIKESEEE